jgi:hypothetical protein
MSTPAIDTEILLFNQSAGHNPVVHVSAIDVRRPASRIAAVDCRSGVFPCDLYSQIKL